MSAARVPRNISLFVVSIFNIMRGFPRLVPHFGFSRFTQTMGETGFHHHYACRLKLKHISLVFIFEGCFGERAVIRKENINDCFFKTRLCTDGKRRKTKAEF